jgi:hypothetical protein
MIAWAIRQKSTGLFMPSARSNGKRRGFTHDEPTGGPPRLFKLERYAKSALKAWLSGEMVESGGYDSWTGEYDIDVKVKPRPERKAEDMEVVKVSIQVRS